mmetsp:Transcript_5247/g.8656  ORF Transcript_5247/g.8656 Transcript_5247/m.8656 type:complete len:219 (-) Transcript_5247:2401-3057(-)
MSSFDTVLIIQIAVAVVIVPLLVSGLLYFLWPNVWQYFADKIIYVWSVVMFPCVAVYTRCSHTHSSKFDDKPRKQEPHYIGPEHSHVEDGVRLSKTKTERKLRVENPKRRELAAGEERLSGGELLYATRKAQATRVEKTHRPAPASRLAKNHSMQAGFKYNFREEAMSEEVNPYLSSGSSPPRMEPLLVEMEGRTGTGTSKESCSVDLESGTTEEEQE